MRLHSVYVNIQVSDFDRALGFYRDVLELPLTMSDESFGYATWSGSRRQMCETRDSQIRSWAGWRAHRHRRHCWSRTSTLNTSACATGCPYKLHTSTYKATLGRLHGALRRSRQQRVLPRPTACAPRLVPLHSTCAAARTREIRVSPLPNPLIALDSAIMVMCALARGRMVH